MPARPSRSLAVAALLCAAPALAGCGAVTGSADSTADGGQLDIATAFYPLQYAVQRVAGERAEVTDLTPPGTEPHDLELSVSVTAELADADLVVHLSGFQPAVDEGIEQNAGGAVLDAADVVDLITFGEGNEVEDDDHGDHDDHDDHGDEHSDDDHGHDDHGHDDHAHDEAETDEHSDEDHGHSHGHSHDDGDLDPHFWLDPNRLAELGDAVADELADLDPDNAEEYASNAASLRSDLSDLDEEYRTGLAQCERDTIVVSHNAFSYLGPYGVQVASVAGLSPDAEPTSAGLARLQDLIADEGITTVFSERLASPRFVEALATDAGVEARVLDPIEGLTDETADEDYLGLMRRNLDEIAEANGCR